MDVSYSYNTNSMVSDIPVILPYTHTRQGRMLEDISGMYSSVFGTKAGPDRYVVQQYNDSMNLCVIFSF